jgi:hypothetical protein
MVGDSDDLFYDASKSRVYVIGGEGFVDVFQQRDPDHYGSRTGFFVPEWGKLFVAVPHRGQQAAEILVYETR